MHDLADDEEARMQRQQRSAARYGVTAPENNIPRFKLSATECDTFKTIHEFLWEFKSATEMICGDTYVTLSKVVPLYTKLSEHIDIFLMISTLTNEMKGAIIKCKDTLERYYDITSHSFTVATLLDPRFRLGYYCVRYGEDPDKNEDLEDILRIA